MLHEQRETGQHICAILTGRAVNTTATMAQAVTRALPLETCNNWAVAPDSVQAISCMVTALNLYNIHGKDFIYESSVEGVLHVLKHLGQSSAYLGIICGGCRRPWQTLTGC